MPIMIDVSGTSIDPETGQEEQLGPVCGIGYGSTYAELCMYGNIPITIDGVGYGSTTPHHVLHGDICTPLILCGAGTAYSHGNVYLKSTVPLSLCIRGEGEMHSKGAPTTMVGSTSPYGLKFGACADITTLTPIRVYCNDLSALVPTLSNHLPEVEGYHNACPTLCPQDMPGDTSRYYPHVMGEEPPPSIWQHLEGVELRILQDSAHHSPYGHHHVWLLADLWYRGQQVMYLRNGTGADAPSRHILNRGALNSLVVYLTRALGMHQNTYMSVPPESNPHKNISEDIALVRKWGVRYTH